MNIDIKPIPKVIHYCWFGGNELTEEAKKCIESWKKNCPDYEIREWNEINFDINICKYTKDAYSAKKWAFVSDYARFWILYMFGGVYFDTDVEVIKPIDDIIYNGPFMGMEKIGVVAPGLGLAANPGLGLYKEILDVYEKSEFYEYPGVMTNENVVGKVTNILILHGLIYDKCEKQVIEGVTIYPPDFFCPKDYISGDIKITNNTRSIHHYTATWITKQEKEVKKLEKILGNTYGIKRILTKFKIIVLKIKNKFMNQGLLNIIKYSWGKGMQIIKKAN